MGYVHSVGASMDSLEPSFAKLQFARLPGTLYWGTMVTPAIHTVA